MGKGWEKHTDKYETKWEVSNWILISREIGEISTGEILEKETQNFWFTKVTWGPVGWYEISCVGSPN